MIGIKERRKKMDCSKIVERNVFLEGQNIALRTIVSALIGESNRNPFCSIGHWVEHGPCSEIISEFNDSQKKEYEKVLAEVAGMVNKK